MECSLNHSRLVDSRDHSATCQMHSDGHQVFHVSQWQHMVCIDKIQVSPLHDHPSLFA